MPKFKTPEEELDYLRAHVAKREQELNKKEEAIKTLKMAIELDPENADALNYLGYLEN